jgi:hypothetical protein
MRGFIKADGSARMVRTAGALALGLAMALLGPSGRAGEPDPAGYWAVKDVRPGMKGIGRTVMVGTTLEEFQVEVLGVLRDVSPGRDMILCRLGGCNLEHAGIIQGMSGSPIYIEGRLLGAVAFAWEFAKDPIAGVTPFAQMVDYVRANDRRIAAEAAEGEAGLARTARLDPSWLERDAALPPIVAAGSAPGAMAVGAGGMAGMRPIATPLAATGFSPRALAMLEERLGPLGLAAAPGGGALEEIVAREGDRPLEPGSPVSIGMVTGDLDLSGIGTVTHVEGDRVYAFGHPMMSLGACEFPMMTGWIHTVYPRASVSMKMGSPLKTVGVLDTDVSTAVSGRLGRAPDMMPMTVVVKPGRHAEAHTYRVQVAREPNLMPTLVSTVLTSAIDTEGDLPEELTARLEAEIRLAGREPIRIAEVLSGPKYHGPLGPSALFSSVASTVNLLSRNPLGPVRIEGIDCRLEVEAARTTADVEAVRVEAERVAPGGVVAVRVTLKPFQGERETVRVEVPLPAELPEGTYELTVQDGGRSLQRLYRNQPGRLEPKTVDDLVTLLRDRAGPSRTALHVHLPLPGRGASVKGQALPDLPGSVRGVLASPRQTADPAVRDDLVVARETAWVLDGAQTVTFTVAKDTGLSVVER